MQKMPEITRNIRLKGAIIAMLALCLITINAYAENNSLIGKWELMSKGSFVGSVTGERFDTIEIRKDGAVICRKNGQTIFEGKYVLKGDSWIKLELSEEQKEKLGLLPPKIEPRTPEEAQELADIDKLNSLGINPLGGLMEMSQGLVSQLVDGKPKQFMLSPGGNELTVIGENYPTVVCGQTIRSTITWEFAKESSGE